MTLTKKELDDVSDTSAKYLAFLNFCVRALRPVARLGFVRRYLARTDSGRVGAISRLARSGEDARAADIAIELLKENRHEPERKWRPGGRDYWWMYMYFAARSIDKLDDREKRAEVIEMARGGVEPFLGYYVARSFIYFSRWKYAEGDYGAAIDFAETAARADDTWAEPDFVLGWYRLALGGGDALTHLTRAVRKDQKIFFRIANDRECRRHPHIIQKLKELSAEGIVTRGSSPEPDDTDDPRSR